MAYFTGIIYEFCRLIVYIYFCNSRFINRRFIIYISWTHKSVVHIHLLANIFIPIKKLEVFTNLSLKSYSSNIYQLLILNTTKAKAKKAFSKNHQEKYQKRNDQKNVYIGINSYPQLLGSR